MMNVEGSTSGYSITTTVGSLTALGLIYLDLQIALWIGSTTAIIFSISDLWSNGFALIAGHVLVSPLSP